MKRKVDKKTNQISSPYLAARQEWNERYGSYIAAAKRWRRVALMSLSITAIAVTCLSYSYLFIDQSKAIPYIVEVNDKAQVVQVYEAEKINAVDHRVMRAQLAQFVQSLRSVSFDRKVQEQAIEQVYAHLSKGHPAHRTVSEWYRSNIPFNRAQQKTVSVEVRHVNALSEDTWRIEWIEHPQTRNGEPLDSIYMTGTLSVVISDVEADTKSIVLNPTGLYIHEFEWLRDYKNTD